MITTVKEFENTYVKNTSELREAFLSTALRLGLIDSISAVGHSSEDAVVAYWHDVNGCNFNVGCWYAYADQIRNECRELTLSDLKEEKAEMKKAKCQKMYTEKHKQDMDFVVIGDDYIGPFTDACAAQKAMEIINNQFAAPKPRTRTEYEKVTESIFDLREEFEAGGLYESLCGSKLENEHDFIRTYTHGHLMRKVEKPVDWLDEISVFLGASPRIGSLIVNDGVISLKGGMTHEEFKELCRVTLRALGEID